VPVTRYTYRHNRAALDYGMRERRIPPTNRTGTDHMAGSPRKRARRLARAARLNATDPSDRELAGLPSSTHTASQRARVACCADATECGENATVLYPSNKVLRARNNPMPWLDQVLAERGTSLAELKRTGRLVGRLRSLV
jgi:hypothetical protein